MQQPDDAYPARLDIDYPEEGLDRVRTAFRIILLIPIVILAGLVSGGFVNADTGDWAWLAGRRRALPAYAADAALPPQVPALVVRLASGVDALHDPRGGLRPAPARRVPLDRRGAGRAPWTSTTPTRRRTSTASCRS